MTVISPLSTTSLLNRTLSVGAAESTITPSTTASESQTTPPSVVVSLSGGSASGNSQAQTYSAQGNLSFNIPPVAVWQNNTQDPITALMAHNYQSTSLGQRFKGLGAALLNRFKTGGGDYSQSVKLTAPAGSSMAAGSSPGLRADVTLQVKTASGTKVTLTLETQDGSLAVKVQSDGKLSDKEQDAIAGLANGFQDALDGMGATPPSLKLAGLAQFDTRVLSAVDLQTTVHNAGEAVGTTVDLHVDKQQRSLNVSGASGKMQVNVNTSNQAIWGSKAQQAAAISNYLKGVDQAAARGQGDTALIGMFKDAFTQMNSNYGAQDTAVFAQPLSARDHAALTGLADFQASVSSTPKSVNPMRPSEVDGFSWTSSQSTRIGGKSALDRTLAQDQQSHLTASYHRPLVAGTKLELKTDPQSQNYYYDQIDDSAQSKTSLAYQNGQLVSASLFKAASQNTHEIKVVKGVLKEDKTTPVQQSQTLDLLGLLQQNQTSPQNAADLLKVHGLILLSTSPADLSGSAQAQP